MEAPDPTGNPFPPAPGSGPVNCDVPAQPEDFPEPSPLNEDQNE